MDTLQPYVIQGPCMSALVQISQIDTVERDLL